MEQFTLPAFIFGLVEMLKIVGVKSKYLPWLAVAAGSLLHPALLSSWTVENAVHGAFVGMIVTGVVNRFLQKNDPTVQT